MKKIALILMLGLGIEAAVFFVSTVKDLPTSHGEILCDGIVVSAYFLLVSVVTCGIFALNFKDNFTKGKACDE